MENNEVSKSNKIKIIVITALIFLVSMQEYHMHILQYK